MTVTGTQTTGVIEDVALLDLTSMTPDEVARITEIRNVAMILVPESLAGALAGIPMSDVASVIPIPDGAETRVHTGSLVMGGDALAEPGGDDVVLVVTGTLVLSSPVERVGYRQVIVTGLVLAPHGSEAALGAGLTRVTGSVDYYRHAEGQQIRSFSGQTRIGGEVLANTGGSPDDVLIMAGQIIVTDPVREVGFQRIFAAGQILAPRESEAVLSSVISASGQIVWYAGHPRFFVGSQSFGRGFFELLDEPLDIALVGSFTIEEDVDPKLLRDKIGAITLVGKITAPKAVVPVLQLLTTENYGKIVVDVDADERS